jgi:hypothetical protein
MKRLILAPLLLLCSCMATREAQAVLELELMHVKDATEELREATMAGATAEELDALDAELTAAIAASKVAAARIPEAVKEDAANFKGGIMGVGAAADGGVLALGLTALSWFMRDRRKRIGADPLQRQDIKTPPTTT